MTNRVFISYSHKDERYRSDLEDHLAMLRRKKRISDWHDRKIAPGDHWKGQIDKNLANADIVILLVSPSFLASDYCFDIELKKAMENHAAGKCKIISIIVRPCDWGDAEFSQFQAVPKDALPISKWENEDDAWLDAVDGIKKAILEFKPNRKEPEHSPNRKHPHIKESTEKWLNDTEIELTHRNHSKLELDHVFVVPDIKIRGGEKNETITIEGAKKALNEDGKFLIAGEEQQGKTSLLKYYYKELLKNGKAPVYIDAEKVKNSDILKALKNPLADQYDELSPEDYLQDASRAILIDNIDRVGLNAKFRSVFLQNVGANFEQCIITCHKSFSYVHNELNELDEYKPLELLGLGHKKREELAKKWLSLGKEESISDTELYEQCDDAKSRLDAIIKHNILPPKPIYVLMLLQMFEANTQLNTELTSYGHCYQQLIYQTFENAKIRSGDFEKYLNVLTEFSWWILKNQKNPNDHEMDSFFSEYNRKYLKVDRVEILRKLEDHKILEARGFRTGFKYPYIYYFFAGKKIAESYRDFEEVRNKVKDLLDLLHREDFANILIFTTHHTKDSWVLSEITEVLSSLFEKNSPASLEKEQLAFMEDFMKKIPELILEQREIQKERDSHNEKLDELERRTVDEDAVEPIDILASINKTFKGMEIAGQIIRNRHASLTTDSMSLLATSGVTSGLRFLKYFIEISDSAKREIIKVIANNLSSQPELSNRQIEKDAEAAYMHLTYGVINGVIRKIASSVGSKEASVIYEKIGEISDTPSAKLIRLSIDLQFKKSLNMKTISNCVEALKDNAVCTRILKEMVIQHIYMFPVGYKEKQQLSSLLGISVRGQRLMDQKKIGKG